MVQGGRIFQTNNSSGRNNGTVWKKRLYLRIYIVFTKLVTFCIKKMELNSCTSHIRTWVYMLHSVVFIKLPDEAHIVAKRVGEIKEVLIQLQV